MSALLSTMERIAEALEARTDPDESLTTAEAARFLRISESTLLRAVRAGLPFYEIKDHGYRFTRPDLIKWREQFKATNYGELPIAECRLRIETSRERNVA